MPFNDNRPTAAPVSTVGFKISKPGFDALRTAGSNLIFDSSWPSLPIAFETTVNKPASNSSFNHNLGFPAFSMVWAYGPDPSGVGNTCMRFFMPVDKTAVYTRTGGFNGLQTNFWNSATKIDIKCFQLDLSQDVDYVLAPGDNFSTPYDKNFGFKAVKPLKDINSTDLRDFTVHSRAQSPLIQAIKTEATVDAANPSVVQYTSRYARAVWVYGFIKAGASGLATSLSVPAGSYVYAPYYGQAYPLTATDGFLSSIQIAAADNGATLVILRDPMFASTQVTAQY